MFMAKYSKWELVNKWKFNGENGINIYTNAFSG